jgi:hypothetical protein
VRSKKRAANSIALSAGGISGQLGALSVDVDRVERLACGHEEAVFLRATETEIGANFRKMDFADERAVGREDVHAVETRSRPTGTSPDIAVDIAADTIG